MALGRIALASIKGIKREIEKEIAGVMSISLTDAVANGLLELKAYGGTEQRNLPSGYTELSSITMQSGICAIGLTQPTADGRVELDFTTTTLDNTTRNFYGGRYNSAPTGAGIRLTHNSSSKIIAYGFDTNSTEAGNYAFQNNTRYKYIYDNGTLTLITGGSTVYTQNFTINDTTTSDVVINGYKQQTGTIIANSEVIAVNSYKVYNAQGVLVENWIPALKGTTVCFYDTVSGTDVLPTEGTFTAGTEVVPTPDTPMDIVTNNGVLKAKHQSGLPLGYTLLDSVTGDGLVGIDTGLKLQAGDEIDMDYEWLGVVSGQSTDRFFLGTSNADVNKGGCRAELYSANGTSAGWYVRFSSLSSVNTQTDMSTQLTGHLTLKQESFTVNNVEILTPTYAGTFQDTTLTYFGRFNATGDTFVGAYLKVSKFTLKNNGVYRYYGIPCKNSSNVIGMYDLVSGTFGTKVGTGTFTAGNTVSDPIEIYTDGTTETIEDELSNTATAEMLLKVGDYADEQEILSGDVTRNVGIKVLDGTETWSKGQVVFYSDDAITDFNTSSSFTAYCTHFLGVDNSSAPGAGTYTMRVYKTSTNAMRVGFYPTMSDYASGTRFAEYLADQYNAGTPVIIVYQLATPTTESVTGQTMDIQAGNNTIDITQASINTLELSAKYKALPN